MSTKLRESIRSLHASLAAPAQQYKELDKMVEYLRSEIGPRIGASAIETFGSCSNGLWTRSSDADMTLIIPRCNTKSKIITKLKSARDFVRKTAPCPLSMSIVENARIPVLKLAVEGLSLREIDVSINNISGIENSLLVKTWASFDPRFTPLAFAIKNWAKARGINDRAKGTLSTYTLLLQVVFIMRSRKMLPPFSSFVNSDILSAPYEELNGVLRPTPFNVSLPPPIVSSNTSIDEGALLRAYFNFFGDENLQQGAEILDGHIITVPTSTGALVMRCPLTNKDVNVMSASAWQSIHSEFRQARDFLRQRDDMSVDLAALSS